MNSSQCRPRGEEEEDDALSPSPNPLSLYRLRRYHNYDSSVRSNSSLNRPLCSTQRALGMRLLINVVGGCNADRAPTYDRR